MTTLFEQNQIFLNQILEKNPGLRSIFQDNLVLSEENKSEVSSCGESTIQDWINEENRIVLHPQMFPSEKGLKTFESLIADVDPSKSVDQYIGMVENDPHLIRYILRLREIEKELGADPFAQNTSLNYKPSFFISFGTGDGKLLKQLVDQFQPFHLCIAIRSMSDLTSSFNEINWAEWWNNRCQNPRQKISIFPYSSTDQLKFEIVKSAFITSEHAIMTCPYPSTDLYLNDRNILCGREMSVQVNYLGFTIDEYNMIWNATQSLCKKPRSFKKPFRRLGGSYIVCGSGPSLDKSLDIIRQLSNDCTIISCASNYRTLRAAGIDVDILCLLERGSYEFDNYLSVKNEYGTGKTVLFASVTCDARLHELFEDSMIFYRPQLTPLSIFSTDPSQILYHEGPQTVNTGVALAAALGADTCILMGVDLGTSDPNIVRSSRAVGSSERTFDIEVKGNFKDSVYSTDLLLDGCLAMEGCIKANPLMKVFNASDGIYIKGAHPITLDKLKYIEYESSSSVDGWYDWWKQRSEFEPTYLLSQWESARIRPQISLLLESVRQLMQSDLPWFIDVQEQLNELLSLNVPIQQQVSRRMHRSILLKICLVITRQCYVLLHQDQSSDMQEKFINKSRALVVELCDQLEEESYELFDLLENQLKKVQPL